MPVNFTRIYRLFFALLGTSALVIQLYASRYSLVEFFSYFTILSNIAALGVLYYLEAQTPAPKNRRFDVFRGAVTLYMTITGLVYWTVLRNEPNLAAYPWINLVAHGIMPIVILVDWIWHPPSTKLSKNVIKTWLAFPLAYLGYSLIHGWFSHWYPYFFINPTKTSYPEMAAYVVGIVLLAYVLSLGLLKAAKRR